MKTNRTEIFQGIIQAVLDGEASDAARLTETGLQTGLSAEELLEEALIPAANRVANKFQGADFNIPDVLLASRAIKAGLHTLRPYTRPRACPYKVVIGTVAGDIHDIGKNIISLFLEFAGFKVIDLGVDVTAGDFIKAIREHKPELLALSALLTTTMGEMAKIIESIQNQNLRDKIKIIVGGGPVTEEFASSIGADAYAGNPQDTIKVVKKMFGGNLQPGLS